jgi:hypothetical protein
MFSGCGSGVLSLVPRSRAPLPCPALFLLSRIPLLASEIVRLVSYSRVSATFPARVPLGFYLAICKPLGSDSPKTRPCCSRSRPRHGRPIPRSASAPGGYPTNRSPRGVSVRPDRGSGLQCGEPVAARPVCLFRPAHGRPSGRPATATRHRSERPGSTVRSTGIRVPIGPKAQTMSTLVQGLQPRQLAVITPPTCATVPEKLAVPVAPRNVAPEVCRSGGTAERRGVRLDSRFAAA